LKRSNFSPFSKNFFYFKNSSMLSVIIPCYNEADNLEVLYNRLTQVMQQLESKYELIFVNDGSTDTTLEGMKSLAKLDNKVRFRDLSRNFGHQIAVSAGLDVAEGEAVVIIDADLQDPPELILEMYEKWKTGFEVVYAQRKSRKGENFLKKFTAKLFYRLLSRITSFEIPVDTGDFRLVDKKVVRALRQMPEAHKYLRGQIAWIGFRQTFVEYERDARHAGETGYTYKKMITLALNGITAFSNIPIKFVTFSGFVVSGIAFFMILFSLYSKYFLEEAYVSGWASLMVSILFLGGIQLISLGILGEYLARVNTEVKQRPLYFVREEESDLE